MCGWKKLNGLSGCVTVETGSVSKVENQRRSVMCELGTDELAALDGEGGGGGADR